MQFCRAPAGASQLGRLRDSWSDLERLKLGRKGQRVRLLDHIVSHLVWTQLVARASYFDACISLCLPSGPKGLTSTVMSSSWR